MDYEKTGYLYNNFKVFHLKDKSDKDYSYHYHDFNKILILISGDVNYSIEGRSYKLEPYDIVLINAGEVHKPIVSGNKIYERIIIYISKDFLFSYKKDDYDLSDCFQKASNNKSHVLRLADVTASLLYKTSKRLSISTHSTDYASELYSNALFLEFMIDLNRAAIDNKITYVENEYSNKKIAEIIDYINNNLQKDLPIDCISKKFFISRYHLMHSFKDETGYSIGNYITTKRLLLARDLIQKGVPVTEACYKVGFNNYSTFSRAYKKCFGTSAKNNRND